MRKAFVYNLREIQIPLTPTRNMTHVIGAIRYGRWKLINMSGEGPIFPLGTFELYDLKEDPNETTDLSRSHPTVHEKMKDIFKVLNHFY